MKVYGTIRVLLKRVSNRDNTHISQDNTQHSKLMDIATTMVPMCLLFGSSTCINDDCAAINQSVGRRSM